MAWRLSLHAKVFAGLHEPHSEELLPETVGRDPRCQRLLRQNQPAGEVEPVWCFVVGHLQWRQEGGSRPLHLFPRLVIRPALHDEAFPHLRRVVKHECLGNFVAERGRRRLVAFHGSHGRRQRLRLRRPDLPHPVALHLGKVGGLGRLLLPLSDQITQRFGDVVDLLLLRAGCPPGGQRLGGVGGGIVDTLHADEIPADMPIELRQGKAGDLGARGHLHRRRRHRETNPLTSRRQLTSMVAGGLPQLAPFDRIRLTPDRAVIPATDMKLQHHRLGWILRVEPDMREDFGIRGKLNRLRTFLVEILGDAGGCPFQTLPTRKDSRCSISCEPADLTAGTLHLGVGGKAVVEPDRLSPHRLRLGIERGWIGVVHCSHGFVEFGLKLGKRRLQCC